MFLGEARKLCPNLRVVSYDFPLYEHLSEKVNMMYVLSCNITSDYIILCHIKYCHVSVKVCCSIK